MNLARKLPRFAGSLCFWLIVAALIYFAGATLDATRHAAIRPDASEPVPNAVSPRNAPYHGRSPEEVERAHGYTGGIESY